MSIISCINNPLFCGYYLELFKKIVGKEECYSPCKILKLLAMSGQFLIKFFLNFKIFYNSQL